MAFKKMFSLKKVKRSLEYRLQAEGEDNTSFRLKQGLRTISILSGLQQAGSLL
jgi:hypothetical protein